MRQIKESDWKLLRRLQPIALDRFCQRVLSEVQETCSDTVAIAHDRYLGIFKLIQDHDKKLGSIFNDIRRSNGVDRLLMMRTSDLITDEEFSEFSEELRDLVQRILSLRTAN